MLKKETIEKLKSFGFDTDKLAEAVKAEAEVDYEIPEVVVMKPTDLEARDANKVAEGKTAGIAEGEKAALGTFKKELGKRLNLTLKGERLGDIASEIETKINSSDNDKIQELTTQNNLLKTDKEKLSTQVTEAEKKASQAIFDSELITHFPSNRSADLTDAERLQLLKMNLQFDTVDGKTVVKRNGEVVRDKNTQNPLSVKDVITSVFTEKNWVAQPGAGGGQNPPPGGRGGGDNPPPGGGGNTGVKKLSQFTDQWKKDNPQGNTMSPEFTAAVNKHAKDTPDFDFYN